MADPWKVFFNEAGDIEPHLLAFLEAMQARHEPPPKMEWSGTYKDSSPSGRTLYFHYANGNSRERFETRREVEDIITKDIEGWPSRKLKDFTITRHIEFKATEPAIPPAILNALDKIQARGSRL